MLKNLITISVAVLLAGCNVGGIRLVKPAVTCDYGGQTYNVGAGRIPAIDGYNTCFCDESGSVGCTEIARQTEPVANAFTSPAAVRCSVAGFQYETRLDDAGAKTGYCVDEAGGTDCPAWEFFRDECLFGEAVQQYTTELTDVTGAGGSGQAETSYRADSYQHTLMTKNLPPLEEDYFYEGWLVRVEPLSVLSTGKLVESAEETGIFTLDFRSEENLTDHTRIVVTLEPEDDDPAPAAHVLEGTLKEAQID